MCLIGRTPDLEGRDQGFDYSIAKMILSVLLLYGWSLVSQNFCIILYNVHSVLRVERLHFPPQERNKNKLKIVQALVDFSLQINLISINISGILLKSRIFFLDIVLFSSFRCFSKVWGIVETGSIPDIQQYLYTLLLWDYGFYRQN